MNLSKLLVTHGKVDGYAHNNNLFHLYSNKFNILFMPIHIMYLDNKRPLPCHLYILNVNFIFCRIPCANMAQRYGICLLVNIYIIILVKFIRGIVKVRSSIHDFI